jgi:hypothetical protein
MTAGLGYGAWCSTCHEKLPDNTRRAFAEHCRTDHPDLYEVAARSPDWTAPSGGDD